MEISSLDTRAAAIGWPVFRDGHVRRFIQCWAESQIARLGNELESVSPEKLKDVQGQIKGLRAVRTLLECGSIEGLISDLKK